MPPAPTGGSTVSTEISESLVVFMNQSRVQDFTLQIEHDKERERETFWDSMLLEENTLICILKPCAMNCWCPQTKRKLVVSVLVD